MNPPIVSPRKRRRLWPWVLALFFAPFLLLAVVAASYLTLDRDAAALRRRVMTATNSDWHTVVQLSIGRISLAGLRAVVAFVPHVDARAKLALQSIHSASVGVYELKGREGVMSRLQLFSEADEAMGRRGFTRLIGVCDNKDTVLIYAPTGQADEKSLNLCLAVVSGRELVVVSTEVNASILAELAAQHSLGNLKHDLHLALR